MKELSKEPVRDRAEHNAYFPSDYSLSVYTSPKTDFDGFKLNKNLLNKFIYVHSYIFFLFIVS